MPIPNNPLVCKVAFLYSRDTRTFVNVFHVADSTGWDLTKMNNLAIDMHAWWSNQYKVYMPAGISLKQIQVRLLDPSNPLSVDYTTGLPESGSFASAMESANVTETISWRSGLAGRKYRGRTFVPGIAEAQVNQDDTSASGFVTALGIIADGLFNHVISGTRFPVIFHIASNLFTRITSYVIENILDSQRRRLPGRGR
jgi:hypothetical protein